MAVVCIAETGKSGSIKISSDKMTARQDDTQAEFSGNVVVHYQNAVINADNLIIYFDSSDGSTKAEPEQNQIEKIIAQGNVIYSAQDRKAYADKAVFTAADQTLVLTGGTPRVTTGTSFVTGEKITVYQKTDQVIVQGGQTSRVEAVFNPED